MAVAPPKIRYHLPDSVRGLTLISMAVYHAVWDMVYLFDEGWSWYVSPAAFWWQQSICWTFILLSGFCFPMSRRSLRRGVILLAASAAVTAVTVLFSPESRIFFGVLCLMGSAMVLLTPLKGALRRFPPALGAAVSFLLFLLTRWVDTGAVTFLGRRLLTLPAALYANGFTAWLGFPPPEFYSADYFPLLPWLFLYLTGIFLHYLFHRGGRTEWLSGCSCPPLEWLGRHSLLLYLVHQPVIYGALWVLYEL
ncbi:MAG: heparan-alpha-glucosaminide N-acetyltransferase domain-containing protein [Dysosmobacter sp.]|nr:heparan-alpha-glucosaminide N-acetyltransferase domain-containing protein [Dysosmobacter sp.]